jgi:hypothetical protein
MSDPNFLTRWSRRKLESPEEVAEVTAAEQPPVVSADERADDSAAAPPTGAKVVPEFDPERLPPIESIDAGSDIRAFLQRGVPAGLTRAALRRAWSADPAIRDFIGLSENAWNFNDPDSITGFGSIAPEDVRRVAAQLFGESGTPETLGNPSSDRNPLVQSASTEGKSEPVPLHEMRTPVSEDARPEQVHDRQNSESDTAPAPVEGQRKVDVAMQYKEEKPEYGPVTLRPRHGGALPK